MMDDAHGCEMYICSHGSCTEEEGNDDDEDGEHEVEAEEND
mgnify:FL=1